MLLFKHNDDNYSLADYFKKKAPGKIYDEDEFRSIIERERARADRTNHQFSLVVLDLGLPDKNHHTTRFILENILFAIPMIRTYECEEERFRPCDEKVLAHLDLPEEEGHDGENPFKDLLKDIDLNK